MNVAIAGLGLIGGSAAKAYHEAGHVLYGLDHDQTVLGFAQLAGVIDVPLDQNNVRECDCLLIALPPSAAIAFLQEWAPYIPAQCLVMDFCGTKRAVCERGFALAQQYGVSRQIIVGDVALLRAAGEAIDATPRGYVVRRGGTGLLRQAACRHAAADMEQELQTAQESVDFAMQG